MYKIVHHYKILLQQYSMYVHAKKKLENQILYIFLYFYIVVSRKHIVGFSKLYKGDFNRFTTLMMVVFSVGSILVSSFKANSNYTFVLFGSGIFWNKFEVESW